MSLLSRLERDFIDAYKAKDETRVAVLRAAKTAAKNKQIELRRELADDEVFDVLAKEAKQRKESIEQFNAGGRPELAAKEEAELAVLAAYLPSQFSDAELNDVIDALIQETGASAVKDMGAVMQALNASHKGRFDGKVASALVRQKLAG